MEQGNAMVIEKNESYPKYRGIDAHTCKVQKQLIITKEYRIVTD